MLTEFRPFRHLRSLLLHRAVITRVEDHLDFQNSIQNEIIRKYENGNERLSCVFPACTSQQLLQFIRDHIRQTDHWVIIRHAAPCVIHY